MILAIDIGNTNIVLGGFEGETILFIERISTNQAATDLEYASDVKTALDVHLVVGQLPRQEYSLPQSVLVVGSPRTEKTCVIVWLWS